VAPPPPAAAPLEPLETGGWLEPPPDEPLLPVLTGLWPLPPPEWLEEPLLPVRTGALPLELEDPEPLEPVETCPEETAWCSAALARAMCLGLGLGFFAWTVRRTTFVPSATTPGLGCLSLLALIA
jgi:hypothetical protein